MLDPLFWPTVATVLPVLALAIVVEARGSISRWSGGDPPRWLRTLQGIFWAIPIAFFVYLEPVAFQALEGVKASHASVSLVTPTVSFSLAVLVVNPVGELLIRANARIVVRMTLFIAAIPIRWKVHTNLVRARKNVRTVKEALSVELVNSATLYSLEHLIKSRDNSDEKDLVVAELAQVRQRLVKRREALKELEQETADTLRVAMANREKARRIFTPELMAQLENAVTQMDFKIELIEKFAKKEALTSDSGHQGSLSDN